MSDKRTSCPTCTTTYKVSVAQLTIAQGMVCCPKCTTSFNALIHLVTETPDSVTTEVPIESISDTETAPESQSSTYNYNSHARSSSSLLKIFDEKVENSNIDLKTYLNNLNYFSAEPISALPSVNWEEQADHERKRTAVHYASWTVINLALFGLLVFQFFWFNPQYLKNSHVMSVVFNNACNVFNCDGLEHHYSMINTNKVKVSKKDSTTQLTGELINYYERSLALPILQVTLKKDGSVVSIHKFKSTEYLDETLASIQRIPKNSPFKFRIQLPVERKSFDSYSLEIIRP